MDIKIRVGWLISGAWLVGVATVAYFKWCSLQTMGLNEIGDFLAGAFSPLAFFWLVLGYLQQGDELGQNTIALKLQADELRQAVLEYRQLNETNIRHLKLLEDERTARALAERESKRMRLVNTHGKQVSAGHTVHGYKFYLKNFGHNVANILLLSTTENVAVKPTRQASLENGESIELTVYTEDWSHRSANISVTYTNGIGESECIRIGVFIFEDCTMMIGLNDSEIDAIDSAFPFRN